MNSGSYKLEFSLAKMRLTKFFLALGLTLLVACAGPANSPAPTPHTLFEAPRIEPEELKQKLEDNANILIVDVRSAEAYEQGHIKGAIFVPLSQIRAGDWVPPPDKEVVLYCSC